MPWACKKAGRIGARNRTTSPAKKKKTTTNKQNRSNGSFAVPGMRLLGWALAGLTGKKNRDRLPGFFCGAEICQPRLAIDRYVHNRLGSSHRYACLTADRVGHGFVEILASLVESGAWRIVEAIWHTRLCYFICCESRLSLSKLFTSGTGENCIDEEGSGTASPSGEYIQRWFGLEEIFWAESNKRFPSF